MRIPLRLPTFFEEQDLDTAVLRNLLEVAFRSVPILFLSASAFLTIAILGFSTTGDPFFLLLSAAALLSATLKLVVVRAYRRVGGHDRESLLNWHRRYGRSGNAYSLVVAAFILATMRFPDEYLFAETMAMALIYSFGLVIFVSVRPGLALFQVTMPTIAGVLAALASTMVEHQIFALFWLASGGAVVAMIAKQYRFYREFFESRLEIDRLARHDALTGLKNRMALTEALRSIRSNRESVALIFIDLDHFKPVNDRHGHHMGDLILQKVATRILADLPDDASAFRFGGDEFVISMQMRAGEIEPLARMLAHTLRTGLERPYMLEGLDIHIGASFGIAISTDRDIDAETLLRRADEALYQAKRENRGSIRTFHLDRQQPPFEENENVRRAV